MLFNTSDTWPQQKSSENKSTRRNANQQQQQNPIQNMSPNELYGALLQYHLHQQQQQMINSQDLFMQQQQQQQQTLLMQDDGNKSLQQYQMMQRAAQMAAAHQQLMTNNNKYELNSPASSTGIARKTRSSVPVLIAVVFASTTTPSTGQTGASTSSNSACRGPVTTSRFILHSAISNRTPQTSSDDSHRTHTSDRHGHRAGAPASSKQSLPDRPIG